MRSPRSLGIGWNDFIGRVEAVGGFGDGTETSLPHTPLAQEALRFAAIEASETGRDIADPEYLLLGTLRIRRCVTVRVLSDLGVSLAGLRWEVSRALRDDGYNVGEV